MILFPPIAAPLFFIWFLCGYATLQTVSLNEINKPDYIKALLTLLILFTGPLSFLVINGVKIYRYISAKLKNAENLREQGILDAIVFESSPGEPIQTKSSDSDAFYTTKRFIYQAVSKRSSDIFIDQNQDASASVRCRIDGILRQIMTIDQSLNNRVVNMIKVMAQMDISEHRRPQDGSFTALIQGRRIAFRVATVGAYTGEKVSIRLLGTDNGPSTLADLKLAEDDFEIIHKSTKLPSGLVLTCGPTGSGKTSTLYTMLKSIDFNIKNVISIEDPIENIIPQISQMEVNTKAGISFAQLLRNSLRQNPDVICLGEIRDSETAEVALQAAQTGHLIIATVHSNDNLGTIDRLQSLGVPLRTIASTLQVIISQRLVRILCPHCKRKMMLPAEYIDYFKKVNLPIDNVYQSTGCAKCDHTGYFGRRGVFDVMSVNTQLKQLLENPDASLTAIQDYINSTHGAAVIAYKAYQLVAAGETTIEEVHRISLEM